MNVTAGVRLVGGAGPWISTGNPVQEKGGWRGERSGEPRGSVDTSRALRYAKVGSQHGKGEGRARFAYYKSAADRTRDKERQS